MASIIKRRKKFSVVYRYTDENGNERQKWESFDTMAEAKKRKLEDISPRIMDKYYRDLLSVKSVLPSVFICRPKRKTSDFFGFCVWQGSKIL